jgi:hypothetical protein
MDSASPIASRIAGQPSPRAGETTFGNATELLKSNLAEFAPAVTFRFDWLSTLQDHARYRGAGHRSATGEAPSP